MHQNRSGTGGPHSRGITVLCVALALLTAFFTCPPVAGQDAILVLAPGPSATVAAGDGRRGYAGDGRPATGASLANPSSLAYAPNGDLYLADAGNHVVRRVTTDGTISTVAGNGVQGFSGDGGPASLASLNSPRGVAIAEDGTLYIADTQNHRVRKVTTAGTITTVVGTGAPGFSGDGSSAVTAALRNPEAVAVGLAGELYIADSGNHRVRRLALDGTITTAAGSGVESAAGDGGPAIKAGLDAPSSVVVRQDGALLIADRRNDKIRIVTTDGVISSVATGGVPLRRAAGVTASSDGTIYVADTGHHQVRQIGPNGSAVVLGSGLEGSFVSPVPTASSAGTPVAVAPDSSGGLAIADRMNGQVYHLALPHLSFSDTPVGSTSAPVSLVLQNGGSRELAIASLSTPSNYAADNSGTCGPLPIILPPSATCRLAFVFRPLAAGASAGYLSIASTGGPSQQALFTGTALPARTVLPSTLIFQAGSAITYAGAPLQLSAAILSQSATVPTGLITFLDGGREIGSLSLNGNGAAHFSTAALTIGAHMLSAHYGGDAHFSASASPMLQETVVAIPDFVLAPTNPTISLAKGSSGIASFKLQPLNGTLNRAVTIQVSGTPPGTSVNVSPATITLGSDPVQVDIAFKAPTTLAHARRLLPLLAGGLLLLLRLKRPRALLALGLLGVVAGCGGGYSSGTGTASSSSRSYAVTVTASTTGVTGEPLIHTGTFTLVIN